MAKTACVFETYELVSYDVWGNAEDGWEVNQSFRTGHEIQVPVGASDKKFLSVAMIDQRIYEVDNAISDENTVYIRRKRDGMPAHEWRLVA